MTPEKNSRKGGVVRASTSA